MIGKVAGLDLALATRYKGTKAAKSSFAVLCFLHQQLITLCDLLSIFPTHKTRCLPGARPTGYRRDNRTGCWYPRADMVLVNGFSGKQVDEKVGFRKLGDRMLLVLNTMATSVWPDTRI